MTFLWITLAVLYAVVGLCAGCIAYAASDPYDHFPPSHRWKQAIPWGVFWLPLLLYVIAAAVWWTYFPPRQDD